MDSVRHMITLQLYVFTKERMLIGIIDHRWGRRTNLPKLTKLTDFLFAVRNGNVLCNINER